MYNLITTRAARVGALIAFLGLLMVIGLGDTAHAAGSTLHRGSSGSQVARLQSYLDNSGRGDYFHYGGGYTGYFGDITRSGLVRWQQRAGHPATGSIAVGGSQWRQLEREQRHVTATDLPPGVDRRSVSAARNDGWAVDLDKSGHTVRVLHYDRAKHGIVVTKSGAVRVGDARGKQYATRNGVWHIYSKGGPDFVSSLYHSKMPYPAFFSGGQAFHYSPSFAAGRGFASHGCANLKDYGLAKYIHDLPYGTPVVVHN